MFLRPFCGVDYPEAFASAQVFEFPDGFAAKVLDPFLCLQNKAFNLLIPDQATHNDQRHANSQYSTWKTG